MGDGGSLLAYMWHCLTETIEESISEYGSLERWAKTFGNVLAHKDSGVKMSTDLISGSGAVV